MQTTEQTPATAPEADARAREERARNRWLDADTVAAIMGRTAGWVRVTQYRALKRLARRLDVNLEATR